MALKIEHQTLSNSGQWWVVMSSTGVSGGTITVYEGTDQQTQLLIGTRHGPYSSLAAADQEAATLQQDNQTVSGSVKAGVSSLNPLSGIASFFQANIWIRVGEVVLGLILIAIGVAQLTHAVPAATKVAKKVGAVALA
jgi:hypothetical protein